MRNRTFTTPVRTFTDRNRTFLTLIRTFSTPNRTFTKKIPFFRKTLKSSTLREMMAKNEQPAAGFAPQRRAGDCAPYRRKDMTTPSLVGLAVPCQPGAWADTLAMNVNATSNSSPPGRTLAELPARWLAGLRRAGDCAPYRRNDMINLSLVGLAVPCQPGARTDTQAMNVNATSNSSPTG
jgi:hypothetical protein